MFVFFFQGKDIRKMVQAQLVYNKKSSKYEKEKRIALTCSFAKDVEAHLFLLYAVPCNCKIIAP